MKKRLKKDTKRCMKLLYISQYFPPEIGAPMNRALANVSYLSENGFEVTVLTEMPNHPKGIIFDGYKKKLFQSEKIDKYSVKRVWVWTSKKKVFYTRMLFYLSFACLGSLYTLINTGKYDILYISSPPLFVAIIGLVTKLFHPKKKIIFEVRDLWPDSAIEMGELNNRKFINMSYRLERRIYEKSEIIVTVTDYIRKQIISKGISENKVKVIANGIEPEIADLTLNTPVTEMEEKRKKGCFIVIYAGILGLAQNISVIVQAASMTEKENIHYFIVGTGPKEEELKKEAEGLRNISFLGEISRNRIHNYLLSADCGIIPLAKLPIFTGAIPSKLFEYMVYGLPVVLGIEGEAAYVVINANAGVTYEPDNAQDLVEKLLDLRNNPDRLNEYRKDSRDYVLTHYNRRKQAEILADLLREVMGREL